jgi:hypothetical protein
LNFLPLFNLTRAYLYWTTDQLIVMTGIMSFATWSLSRPWHVEHAHRNPFRVRFAEVSFIFSLSASAFFGHRLPHRLRRGSLASFQFGYVVAHAPSTGTRTTQARLASTARRIPALATIVYSTHDGVESACFLRSVHSDCSAVAAVMAEILRNEELTEQLLDNLLQWVRIVFEDLHKR